MRPSTGRFMQLLKKSAVPKNAQHRVIPPLGHPSVTPTQATLVDQLIARKEAYEKVFEIAQKSADEGGGLSLESISLIKPWPTNLRIEPILKREAFSQIVKEARLPIKQALKER